MFLYDGVPVYTADEFDISLLKRPEVQVCGNRRPRKKYLNLVCAFDIETTRLREIEQSIMYIWQFCIDGKICVIGRTWEELKYFFNKLSVYIGENWLCVFVHNFAYEFQFLRAITDWSDGEVFAIDRRKPVKASMPEYHIEFRCSYIHSNLSLGAYTDKMKVKHKKLIGELDYTIIRFPWTPLNKEEIAYSLNDVIGLCEAIQAEMALEKDTLYSFPLTSTGYVRRDYREASPPVVKDVRKILPTLEIYKRLREAFRGGNTHANRYFVGRIIRNVHSYDISSSYPFCIANCKFPMAEFQHESIKGAEALETLIYTRGKAVLATLEFRGLDLINLYEPIPYISYSQCRNCFHCVKDNGRILEAETLEITITDIDYKIIKSQYKWESCNIIDCFTSSYDFLPRPYRMEIIKYYGIKTALKGVKGQELFYAKTKEKVNSAYGMMAQNPVKQDILFMNGEWSEGNEDENKLLIGYQRKAFLAYQWGVWITAHARNFLQEGIDLVKKTPGAYLLYCDTDSCKYIGGVDWEKLNSTRKKQSLESGSYATSPDGKKHFMGVYEFDGDYYEFVTMGAKKYAYTEAPGGECKVTVAGVVKHSGVNKNVGGKELTEAGGLKEFRPGFIFKKAGGTEILYNDNPEIPEYEICGHKIKITPNAVIRESTYTLGYTQEFELLIGNCQKSEKLFDVWKSTLDFV